MHFTREPIIETIISPKEGFKLVARNTKGATQDEFMVDALEVVSFGNAFFYRSLERPKSFLVPVTDYEVLEVRDTRLVLKQSSTGNKAIKIVGNNKSKDSKEPKENKDSKDLKDEKEPKIVPDEKVAKDKEDSSEAISDKRLEKKRERRRNVRKRKVKEEQAVEANVDNDKDADKDKSDSKASKELSEGGDACDEILETSSSIFPTILPPPKNLISERFADRKDEKVSKGNLLPAEVKEETSSNKDKKEEVTHGSSVDSSEESTERQDHHADESCVLGFNVPHK